jgi:hypothetical protein
MPSFKTITARITQEQYEALRAEAEKRAESDGGHADASRIIREMLVRWMEEAKPRKSRK